MAGELTAMAAIHDAVDLFSKTSNSIANNKDNINNTVKLFSKAKSISEAASKYVMEYPVAVSDSIIDVKTGIAIAKQIEMDCARFIILASNLNPVLNTNSKDTIEAHIGALTSEESFPGVKISIRPATQDDLERGHEYMENEYSDEEYIPFIKSNSFATKSVEVVDEDMSNKKDFEASKPKQSPLIPETETIDKVNSLQVSYNDGLSKVNKLGPTIVNLNLVMSNVSGNNNSITIPIAVKATLQYINHEEVKDILGGVKNPAAKLHNFIKLTTGEVKFLRDFILDMDNAKKDALREKQLGNFPFYRQLLAAKTRNRGKNLINSINNMIFKKNQRDMPMCTIIVTADDLMDITGFRLSQILQKPKFVKEAIDEYMLLGFGIVDQVNETLYLYYAGEDNPTIADITKLGKSGDKSDNSDLIKSLAKLAMRR